MIFNSAPMLSILALVAASWLSCADALTAAPSICCLSESPRECKPKHGFVLKDYSVVGRGTLCKKFCEEQVTFGFEATTQQGATESKFRFISWLGLTTFKPMQVENSDFTALLVSFLGNPKDYISAPNITRGSLGGEEDEDLKIVGNALPAQSLKGNIYYAPTAKSVSEVKAVAGKLNIRYVHYRRSSQTPSYILPAEQEEDIVGGSPVVAFLKIKLDKKLATGETLVFQESGVFSGVSVVTKHRITVTLTISVDKVPDLKPKSSGRISVTLTIFVADQVHTGKVLDLKPKSPDTPTEFDFAMEAWATTESKSQNQ